MSARFVPRGPAWLVHMAMVAAFLGPALTVAAQSRAEPPARGRRRRRTGNSSGTAFTALRMPPAATRPPDSRC